MVSLKSWSSVEFKIKKIFFIFVFFEELSRIEFCVNTGYLFKFSVIFLQTKVTSIKTVFQT